MSTRLIAAGAVTALTATMASAAPTATLFPYITGTPKPLNTIRCNPGQWTGAVSVTTLWRYANTRRSASPTLRILPNDAATNPTYECEVTATDETGAQTVQTTSVRVSAKRMTLRFTLTSPSSGRLRLAGVAGPRQAMRIRGGRAVLLLYRVGTPQTTRILASRFLPASGRFRLNVPDARGRHRYRIEIQTPSSLVYLSASRTVTRTVR